MGLEVPDRIRVWGKDEKQMLQLQDVAVVVGLHRYFILEQPNTCWDPTLFVAICNDYRATKR